MCGYQQPVAGLDQLGQQVTAIQVGQAGQILAVKPQHVEDHVADGDLRGDPGGVSSPGEVHAVLKQAEVWPAVLSEGHHLALETNAMGGQARRKAAQFGEAIRRVVAPGRVETQRLARIADGRHHPHTVPLHLKAEEHEAHGDRPGRSCVALLHAAAAPLLSQPPREGERGRHLDRRVEPEPDQAHRSRGDASRDRDDAFDGVP
jgi:hypothetical protein